MWHVGDIAEKKKCKTGQHEKMAIFNESNPDSYRSIYGSLFSEFGEEITTKIHRAYAGRQISFPKKLYTEEYINYYVQKNKTEKSPGVMADELECTERIVRRHMKESRDMESEQFEQSVKTISRYRPVYNELYLEFGEKKNERNLCPIQRTSDFLSEKALYRKLHYALCKRTHVGYDRFRAGKRTGIYRTKNQPAHKKYHGQAGKKLITSRHILILSI